MTQKQPRYSAADLTHARARLMQATSERERLENEQKKPTWRTRQTHETLRQQLADAKVEEGAANADVALVMQHGGNVALASEKRQLHEAEIANKREEQQQERSAHMEASAKQEHHDRFLANGGTHDAFESAWPGMWSKLLEEKTLAGRNVLIDDLKQSGQYSM